jgi:hypothetical protein
MSYVLVTADFPGVNAGQKAKIYSSLKKKWQQVNEPASGATFWLTSFQNALSETDFIKVVTDFVSCAQPYCNPRLTLQLSPTKPALGGVL